MRQKTILYLISLYHLTEGGCFYTVKNPNHRIMAKHYGARFDDLDSFCQEFSLPCPPSKTAYKSFLQTMVKHNIFAVSHSDGSPVYSWPVSEIDEFLDIFGFTQEQREIAVDLERYGTEHDTIFSHQPHGRGMRSDTLFALKVLFDCSGGAEFRTSKVLSGPARDYPLVSFDNVSQCAEENSLYCWPTDSAFRQALTSFTKRGFLRRIILAEDGHLRTSFRVFSWMIDEKTLNDVLGSRDGGVLPADQPTLLGGRVDGAPVTVFVPQPIVSVRGYDELAISELQSEEHRLAQENSSMLDKIEENNTSIQQIQECILRKRESIKEKEAEMLSHLHAMAATAGLSLEEYLVSVLQRNR